MHHPSLRGESVLPMHSSQYGTRRLAALRACPRERAFRGARRQYHLRLTRSIAKGFTSSALWRSTRGVARAMRATVVRAVAYTDETLGLAQPLCSQPSGDKHADEAASAAACEQ